MDGFSTTAPSHPSARQSQRAPPRTLALLPIAAVLLPLTILGVSAWVNWQAQWRNAEAVMVRTTDAGAEYVGRLLAGYRFALGRFADVVQGLSDAEIITREGELHASVRRMIADLSKTEAGYVADGDGVPLLGISVFPVPRDGINIRHRDYFQALAGPDPPALYVSGVHIGQLNGKAFFALSRRRENAGNGLPPGTFDGIVSVLVSPEILGEGMQMLLREASDIQVLARDDGTVLARTSAPPTGTLGRTIPFPAGPDRYVDRDAVSVIDGQRLLVARSRIEGMPLFISTRRLRSTIIQDWWRDEAPELAFGLPVTLALLLLSLRVTRDQARLAAANAQLGAALVESRHWMQRISEGAGISAWENAGDGRAIFRNAESARLWGFKASRGWAPFAVLLDRVRPDHRAGFLAMFETARRTGHARREYAILRPASAEAAALPATLAWLCSEAHLIDAGTPGERMVGITYDITARRIAEQQVADLLHRAVAEREAERLRIARDLHDGLGQHLTLLHLELAGLAEADARADRLRSLATEIGREVQRLALEIRPTAIDDLGLATAIRQMIEDWGARAGLLIELHLRLPAERLPLAVETTLYRVIQEALTNVVKHAGASRVGVILETSHGQLRLVIEDDGQGMPARSASGRLGLQGMAERLALIEGSLEVESAPGRGTSLLVAVRL